MIYLRELELSDLPLMMAWRSNAAIYENCYTQKQPLEWEEHYNWFQSRGRWWKFFIIMFQGSCVPERPVGIVNFGQLDNWNPEFNYYLGEVSLWGKGVGKMALSMGIEWLKMHGYCAVHTTVVNGNERSEGVLKSLGFRATMPARKGETRWDLVLADKDDASEYSSGRCSFKRVSSI